MKWNTIVKNWKTSAAGIITLLLSVPQFVAALQAWGAGQPVNWRAVLVSVALSIGGVGLVAAKDSTTHSTADEIGQAVSGPRSQG
jgi:drug/metabolite transporter (DMT)-like permease